MKKIWDLAKVTTYELRKEKTWDNFINWLRAHWDVYNGWVIKFTLGKLSGEFSTSVSTNLIRIAYITKTDKNPKQIVLDLQFKFLRGVLTDYQIKVSTLTNFKVDGVNFMDTIWSLQYLYISIMYSLGWKIIKFINIVPFISSGSDELLISVHFMKVLIEAKFNILHKVINQKALEKFNQFKLKNLALWLDNKKNIFDKTYRNINNPNGFIFSKNIKIYSPTEISEMFAEISEIITLSESIKILLEELPETRLIDYLDYLLHIDPEKFITLVCHYMLLDSSNFTIEWVGNKVDMANSHNKYTAMGIIFFTIFHDKII